MGARSAGAGETSSPVATACELQGELRAVWGVWLSAAVATVAPCTGGMVWKASLAAWFIVFLSLFIFERERERQSMSRGGADREGDTESKAGSRLRAVSAEPDVGLELTDREIMT